MTSQLTTKLRLVRCPKCRGVLQELANVPVYECGGCGAILQAKKRKNDSKDKGSHTHEMDTTPRNDLRNAPADKGARVFSQEEKLPSAGDLPLDNNSGRNQSEIEDSNGKQYGGISLPGEIKPELTCRGGEESSTAAIAETKVDQYICPMEQKSQNNGGVQSEYGSSNKEQAGSVNFSDEIAFSAELQHHDSESHCQKDENRASVEQNNDLYQKQPGDEYFSNENSSSELNHHNTEKSSSDVGGHSEECENRKALEGKSGRNESENGDSKREEWPGPMHVPDELSSSTKHTRQDIKESSTAAGTSTELDEDLKNHIIFESLRDENLLVASPRGSITQRRLGEIVFTDDLKSPDSKQPEQYQKRAVDGFDGVSSLDTLDNIELANSSSEFAVRLRDIPTSPTSRANGAYDGSVSSYDGIDDQVSDQHLHLPKRKFKETESARTKAMPKKEEVSNKIRSAYPAMQRQAGNTSSISLEKKRYTMKDINWCQDEMLEPVRHGNTVRSRMKFEKDERRSNSPFYSSSQVVYGNRKPSNYGRNEFQCSTSFDSPRKPEYPEEEKMELLRMFYELKDQLSRIQMSKGKDGRFSGVTGKIPPFCDHEAPEMEACHDLNCSRYQRRCQGKIWHHPNRIPRVPFSTEATIRRHQDDQHCLHCCHQDWQCSSLLPPCICCNKSQCTAHVNRRCYNPYGSIPSSPQHHTGSECPLRSCDAMSDDHRLRTHEAKKNLREKNHTVKRHVRPVAAGAPFVICYHCSELLQMPADFLLFRKRCHQLQCSACSVILQFSLEKGTHIVRCTDYDSDAVAPPPSEVDHYSDADNGKKLVPTSYSNERMSCSDDCGPSLYKSSTEGEPSYNGLPFHAPNRDSTDRKMSSVSSSEPVEEGLEQDIPKESKKKYKNPVEETFAAAGPSSKMSKAGRFFIEIEETPRLPSSPLHRLMGYSSPSKVMDR